MAWYIAALPALKPTMHSGRLRVIGQHAAWSMPIPWRWPGKLRGSS